MLAALRKGGYGCMVTWHNKSLILRSDLGFVGIGSSNQVFYRVGRVTVRSRMPVIYVTQQETLVTVLFPDIETFALANRSRS